MAIRYTVFTQRYKCPHCGYQYDYTAQSTGLMGGRDHGFKYYLDNPIIKCKKCGGTFVDYRLREYITMPDSERATYFQNYASKGPTVWIVIFAIYAISGLIGAIASQVWYLLIMTAVAGLLMLIPIKIKSDRNKRITNRIFDEPIIQSLNRCKDKNHLLELALMKMRLYPLNDV